MRIIGFTTKLITVNTAPTINAVQIGFICIPSIKYDAAKTAIESSRTCLIIFIPLEFLLLNNLPEKFLVKL
jgi:hypothetical protein